MRVKKKAGYHHGDLRRTLIDVSVDVVNKQGVEALNLRALATRAGVSSGAPYHHFVDRADLLAAVAQQGFELLAQDLLAARDTAPSDASARLQALGQAYVGFAVSHPGHFRVMFRGDAHPVQASELAAASGKAFMLLAQAIEDCQIQGVAPSGDTQALVVTAWALVHGLATLWVDGTMPERTMDPAKLTPVLTGLLSQMFAALAREKQQEVRCPTA